MRDETNIFADLSPPALAVQRATEGVKDAPDTSSSAAGSAATGVLATGRMWVQFEGWLLKEGHFAGGWHPRFFCVSGDRLEYFEEKAIRLQLRTGELPASLLGSAGLELDQTNVLCASASATGQTKEKTQLHEGDVIIGLNNEPVVGMVAHDVLQAIVPKAGAVIFTLLRPKGRITLHGASVQPAGPRKHGGGHTLTVSVNDSSSRRSRYNLVCSDERLCLGWVAAIKEAIAASAMEDIKTALSQALQLQALQQKQQQHEQWRREQQQQQQQHRWQEHGQSSATAEADEASPEAAHGAFWRSLTDGDVIEGNSARLSDSETSTGNPQGGTFGFEV